LHKLLENKVDESQKKIQPTLNLRNAFIIEEAKDLGRRNHDLRKKP
jgi:hypothetical protein